MHKLLNAVFKLVMFISINLFEKYGVAFGAEYLIMPVCASCFSYMLLHALD